MKIKKFLFQSELSGEFSNLSHNDGLHPIINRDDDSTIFIDKKILEKSIEANKKFFESSPNVKILAEQLLKLFNETGIDVLVRDISCCGYSLGFIDYD